jgi:hypothetical protein
MPYTVTVSMTADDYKRPVNTTETFRAESLHDAKAIALNAYLDRTIEYPSRMKALARAPLAETVFATLHSAFGSFEVDEDADADAEEAAQEAHEKTQAEARLGLVRLIDPLFDWFKDNEATIFRGEYVPKDLSITIEKDGVECDERPDLEDSFESLFAQLEEELPEAREEAKAAASKGKKKRA